MVKHRNSEYAKVHLQTVGVRGACQVLNKLVDLS